MDSVEFDHLLRDAGLVAWYATRHGKLPRDSQIFSLIESVNNGGATDSKNIADLSMETNRVIREIGSITASLLIHRWSFFDIAKHMLVALAPFFLGFLTLLLTIYLAFQNSQLTQADTAIREYQAWVNGQPREKLYNAWKMYHYEQVLNVKGPPLDQLDSYQRLVDEVKQAGEKGDSLFKLLGEASRMLYLPKIFEVYGPDFTRRLAENLNNASSDIPPEALIEKAKNENLRETNGGNHDDPCVDSSASPIPSKIANTEKKQHPAAIEEYSKSYDCFLKQLGIPSQTFSYPLTWDTIFLIRAKINLMMTWFLPGLYGLLGACVYLLRESMHRNSVTPPAHKQFIGTLLQLLRISLGGLAGIIIGWFVVPSATSGNGSVVASISSIPFGLAFMAGFSIDTLFSLLERIKRTIDTSEK